MGLKIFKTYQKLKVELVEKQQNRQEHRHNILKHDKELSNQGPEPGL